MRWKALFCVLLACLAPLSAEAGEIVHKVVKGQTLGRIAKRYRVKVEVLREVNDLKPGQMLRPGLLLVIPERGKEEETLKKAAERRKAQEKNAAKEKAGDKNKRDPSKKNASKDDKKKGKAEARATSKRSESYEQKPKRQGFVKMVRGTEQVSFQLLSRKGRLVPGALPHLGRMMRFEPTGAQIAPNPGLATMIGMVSDHFGGRTLHVVSGFRPKSPKQYTRHSKHNLGHALDFSVEGVPNTVVRDFCRTFRHGGVGYYPNSTFVHLDARPEKVYWVDYSRPGERPRYSGARPKTPSAAPPPVVDDDEAADDLAGDSPDDEGGKEPKGGSKETQESPSQAVDSLSGNHAAPDQGSEKPAGAGQE